MGIREKTRQGMMKKREKILQEIRKHGPLEQINLNAAGIDIGSAEMWVCVPEDRAYLWTPACLVHCRCADT